MRSPVSEINVTTQTFAQGVPELAFRQLQLSHGLRFTQVVASSAVLPVDDLIDGDWTVRYRVSAHSVVNLLAENRDGCVLIHGGIHNTEIECASVSAESTRRIAGLFQAKLDAFAVEPDPRNSHVRMWSCGRHGPQRSAKTLTTIPWHENRDNYPGCVARSIEDLTRLDNPEHLAGRVVLWHGEPGTGKTSAIRSLIHQWQDWCTPHCIIDPDRFFDDPTYIAEVLTCPDQKRWKLVIAEDCDEYISQRPGGFVTGSLSRLLNLTDGLFGQGSNTIVLLTSNASISRLHPAITRPGRCLSTIEFTKFSRSEAARRTGARDAPPMTLAQLFEIKNGGTVPTADAGDRGYV